MTGSPWRLSWRADPVVRVIADRHYNRQKIGAAQFVPPGRCLVLKTFDGSAAWSVYWPYAEFAQHEWAGAWVNNMFRNEGGLLSSDLIRWGVAHTRAKWPQVPELGIVTFVDPAKVRSKRTPGLCYLCAGWTYVGLTKSGLLVFQQLPDRGIGEWGEPMPAPVPAPGSPVPLFDLEEGAA